MKSTTLFSASRLRLRAGRAICAQRSLIRQSSTDGSHPDLETSLRAELTSRPANDIQEYISNTNSHLLNLTLADFLPSSCYPLGFTRSSLTLPKSTPSGSREDPLPPGHHLVHFPPQVLTSDLLPDGTDNLHSPGPPFVRRMWAGGELTFNNNPHWHLHRNNMVALCKEDIPEVWVKGNGEDEKVFVKIRRRIGGLGRSHKGRTAKEEPITPWGETLRDHKGGSGKKHLGRMALVETRNLVFMREKSREIAEQHASSSHLTVRRLVPPHIPDFSVSLIPTPALLFRFSALTFNAHRIHLDAQYCREVEGHRNLLVHGPLTLVLMLSVVRSQLREGEMVMQFDYRNLVPLYVEEEMRICVRRDRVADQKFHVWIEGLEGGLAVKATALVGSPYVPKGIPPQRSRTKSPKNTKAKDKGPKSEIKAGKESQGTIGASDKTPKNEVEAGKESKGTTATT